LSFLPKLKKLIIKNSNNPEFLLNIHKLLFDEKYYELALLVAVCLKNEKLISSSLNNPNFRGRCEFRNKKLIKYD
jgi:hypothetical protein